MTHAPRLRTALLAGLLAFTGLLLAACDANGDTESLNDLAPGQAPGLDMGGILNDLDEVRALFAQAPSNYSGDVIADVSFANDTLTVTVTDEVNGLEDAERFCQDLSQAIATTDVSITVEDMGGTPLAQCRFTA